MLVWCLSFNAQLVPPYSCEYWSRHLSQYSNRPWFYWHLGLVINVMVTSYQCKCYRDYCSQGLVGLVIWSFIILFKVNEFIGIITAKSRYYITPDIGKQWEKNCLFFSLSQIPYFVLPRLVRLCNTPFWSFKIANLTHCQILYLLFTVLSFEVELHVGSFLDIMYHICNQLFAYAPVCGLKLYNQKGLSSNFLRIAKALHIIGVFTFTHMPQIAPDLEPSFHLSSYSSSSTS